MSCQNCSILWEEHRKTFIYFPTTQLVFCAIWDCSDIALVIPYKLALIIPHSSDLTLLLHVYHKKDKHSGILLCLSSPSVIHASPYCKCLLLDLNASLLLCWEAQEKSLRWLVISAQNVGSWKYMLWAQFCKPLGQMYRAKHAGSLCIGITSMLALKQALKGLSRVQLFSADLC